MIRGICLRAQTAGYWDSRLFGPNNLHYRQICKIFSKNNFFSVLFFKWKVDPMLFPRKRGAERRRVQIRYKSHVTLRFSRGKKSADFDSRLLPHRFFLIFFKYAIQLVSSRQIQWCYSFKSLVLRFSPH